MKPRVRCHQHIIAVYEKEARRVMTAWKIENTKIQQSLQKSSRLEQQKLKNENHEAQAKLRAEIDVYKKKNNDLQETMNKIATLVAKSATVVIQ